MVVAVTLAAFTALISAELLTVTLTPPALSGDTGDPADVREIFTKAPLTPDVSLAPVGADALCATAVAEYVAVVPVAATTTVKVVETSRPLTTPSARSSSQNAHVYVPGRSYHACR